MKYGYTQITVDSSYERFNLADATLFENGLDPEAHANHSVWLIAYDACMKGQKAAR